MWGALSGIVIVFICGYLERGGPNMDSYACPSYCQVQHNHKELNESYKEYIKRKQTSHRR
jgi:hypothetical protein